MTVKELMLKLDKLNPRHDADIAFVFRHAGGKQDVIENNILVLRDRITEEDVNPPICIALEETVYLNVEDGDEVEAFSDSAVLTFRRAEK